MAKPWTRWKLDSFDDARKLKDLINSQWEYRSRYIDQEGSTLLTPKAIPKKTVIELAAQLGLVCIDSDLENFRATGGETDLVIELPKVGQTPIEYGSQGQVLKVKRLDKETYFAKIEGQQRGRFGTSAQIKEDIAHFLIGGQLPFSGKEGF